MPESLRRIAVIGSARIPFARSNGRYAHASNQEMLTAAFAALVERFGLARMQLGEVAAGAVIKHSRDWNLTREAALGAGLDPRTPAYDVQRACGTSLTTAIQIGQRIALGEIEVGIAGGVDTTSDVPLGYSPALNRVVLDSARGKAWAARMRPWLGLKPGDLKPATPGVVEPRTGMSMGEHCERMAKQWRIGRTEQDELAYRSHRNAGAAWRDGFYDELVVPFAELESDNNVRSDTTLDKLAALKPVYDRTPAGTLTAGNSTPLTDGASCVLLASDSWAKAHGLAAQAYLTHWSVAAVDFVGISGPAEGLLMAPAYAVPAMLDRAGLRLQEFDIYEIHEAFAAQVLCTLAAWSSDEYCRSTLKRPHALGEIDLGRLNPVGGSVALGHPFAATGTRIIGTLARQLQQRGGGRGLISICTAGGMGVTAILER
jgi:acetyl-CoA C-acetyltransferase